MLRGCLLLSFILPLLGGGYLFAESYAEQTVLAHPPHNNTAYMLRSTSTKANTLRFNKLLLKPRSESHRFNEPFDLIELIPIVRDINRLIPRQFSLVDHRFKLDAHKVQISHEYMDIETRKSQKNSIISFSYQGGTQGSWGSELDVPLFYSSMVGLSNWSRYPMGNYTMTIRRNYSTAHEHIYYIRARTRF